MTQQYFAREPDSDSRPVPLRFSFRGHDFHCLSDAGVFSKGKLDKGTATLLDSLPDAFAGRFLDLGCGWGPVGLCAARLYPGSEIVMADVNSRALDLARQNLRSNGLSARLVQSDGLAGLPGSFDLILLNPPIRAGKAVIYRLFRECAENLSENGALHLVIQTKQGAPSALKELATLFEQVDTLSITGGYRVLAARRPKGSSVT